MMTVTRALTSVTTGALLAAVPAPGAPRTARGVTLRPAVSSLAAAEVRLHTGAVMTAASGARGLAVTSGLLIAGAAGEEGDQPRDVLHPPLGHHGGHPLRAEKGRGEAQRVLLDPDRLHEGHVDLGCLQLLENKDLCLIPPLSHFLILYLV